MANHTPDVATKGVEPPLKVRRFRGRFADAPSSLNPKDVRHDFPVSHGEILGKLREGRKIRDVVIETLATTKGEGALHLLYLSCGWMPRTYRIYRVSEADRPRFFRDLDRLVTLIRNEFHFAGTISIRLQASPLRARKKTSTQS